VRKNIAALNGSVELDSAEGYGTRVTVPPAADAGHHGWHVDRKSGGETYILPLASVVESFPGDAGHGADRRRHGPGGQGARGVHAGDLAGRRSSACRGTTAIEPPQS